TSRKTILKQVQGHQKKLQRWAKDAPMNFLHKAHLVAAERARVLDDHREARALYDQAIALAHQHEYWQDEALAHELAARFYAARQESGLARYYLHNAYGLYQRWGASAKVKALEAAYPQEFPAEPATARRSTTTQSQTSSLLDLSSLLKASQAISSTIVLDALLARLMKIVVENAGAEKGYLLLPQGSAWMVAAEGRIDGGEASVEPFPAAGAEAGPTTTDAGRATPLPNALVNYVARTHEAVVLNDAVHAGAFRQDPYIVAYQPKSVLCMPLLHQRQLTGLFYLENNLATNAFTDERVEVLSLLSSQAAISIENARLYENLAISEQRFRTLFEHAPLGLFEIDLEATNPVILAANRQAELVYGWSAAEFAGLPIERLVPPESLSQIRQTLNHVESGMTITLETTGLRRGGDAFPARISATPQGRPGLNRLIITVEDITLEKQRQAEIEAIEAERRRIAHEIHDGLAQDLAALRFKATLWHDLVDKNPANMHAELDQLTEILNGSIREVRRSIFALRPIALDELGFFPALRQFCTNFGEQYQLAIKLTILGAEERLPSSFELPLFRVVQETLNNSRKHAQAHTIQICLDLRGAGALTLTIHDDGQGFDPATLSRVYREGHVGLK
ncbi:MAG TPA: histidine kinase, partial [Caldilineaceae bacterium]|nr:histidine kinase [Caldilineaceae bacterium]